MGADGGRVGALVGLEPLEVAPGLGGGPGQHEGEVVHQRRLGEFLEGILVRGDVDHGEQDAQVVRPAQGADPPVDVFRVQAVVFQAEEERARGGAQDVVARDLAAVFPGEGADVRQERVAFLPEGDQDRGGGEEPRGEGLRGGLVGFGRVGWGGWWRGAGGERLRGGLVDFGRGAVDGGYCGGEIGVVAEVVVHFSLSLVGGGGEIFFRWRKTF